MERVRQLRTSTALILFALAANACAHQSSAPSNAELWTEYDRGGYADIVSAEPTRTSGAFGDAISVRAIEQIENELIALGAPIVERCVEHEMDRLDALRLRGSFAFEVEVGVAGEVLDAKLLTHDVRDDDASVGASFGRCVETQLNTLALTVQPETSYVHTYVGSVGEAW